MENLTNLYGLNYKIKPGRRLVLLSVKTIMADSNWQELINALNTSYHISESLKLLNYLSQKDKFCAFKLYAYGIANIFSFEYSGVEFKKPQARPSRPQFTNGKRFLYLLLYFIPKLIVSR